MKPFFRKTVSLLLAASLLSGISLSAQASEALGEDLTAKDTLLNYETQLSTNVFWSTSFSDLRTENLITYTPNEDVTPIVTYGSVLTSRNTVSSAAKTLESQGYRVVAGDQRRFLQCRQRPAHRPLSLRRASCAVRTVAIMPSASGQMGLPSSASLR